MLANPDGSSLSLFQTGEATTQKKKKKIWKWCSPNTRWATFSASLPVYLSPQQSSVCIHHTEEASSKLSNEAVSRHCVLMSAPPARTLTSSVSKSYRSWECLLVEHCSSALSRLPWIPGAWPHYNFHT